MEFITKMIEITQRLAFMFTLFEGLFYLFIFSELTKLPLSTLGRAAVSVRV